MKKTIATFLIIVGALAYCEIANAQQAISLCDTLRIKEGRRGPSFI